MIGGDVEGNPDVTVSTFAKIEEGHPGALSFLANPKYTHHVYDTASSVVLVRRDFVPEHPVKATMIRVDDPYATIAHLLDMVTKMTAVDKRGIEQPSFIAPGVEIPDDAYVGAFAYIGAGAVIGAGAKIYPQTYVGDRCKVGEGTVLYMTAARSDAAASSIPAPSSAATDSDSLPSTDTTRRYPRPAMSSLPTTSRSAPTPP